MPVGRTSDDSADMKVDRWCVEPDVEDASVSDLGSATRRQTGKEVKVWALGARLDLGLRWRLMVRAFGLARSELLVRGRKIQSLQESKALLSALGTRDVMDTATGDWIRDSK